MIVIRSIKKMSLFSCRLRRTARRIGFVPTMGALHEGHLSLIRRARQDSDTVVVSVFVNPIQFGPKEDFKRYPRSLGADARLCRKEGVDIMFLPDFKKMYPAGYRTYVYVEGLSEVLCGTFRPGHFKGVTTVVAKLFNLVLPDAAYFGQKDAQQVRVIRQMVREQGLPVEIVPMPTVREPDGLAMSSRNVYLSPEERQSALVLPRALELARKMVLEWGLRDADLVRESLEDYLRQKPQVQVEYISIADEETLEELHHSIERPALVLLAARVGATRLIDNTLLVPEGVEVPEGLHQIIEDIKAGMREHGGTGP